MVPKWPQVGPWEAKWAQVTSKLGQVGLKLPFMIVFGTPLDLENSIFALVKMQFSLKSTVATRRAKMTPKLVPSWSQVGPSWPQVGPKLAQVGPKLAPSWPKLAQVGPSCPHLSRKPNPTEKTQCFGARISGSANRRLQGGRAGGRGFWGSLPSVNVGFCRVFALATTVHLQIASLHGLSEPWKAQWPDLQWGWRPKTGH